MLFRIHSLLYLIGLVIFSVAIGYYTSNSSVGFMFLGGGIIVYSALLGIWD